MRRHFSSVRTFVDRTDKSEHPKCNYCGSVAPANGFTTKDVLHRGMNGPQTSRFTVCAGTTCGGSLQMGYEG
jgi:hypothetical protein